MLTLNGLDTTGAVLSFPRTGVWSADVRVDTPDDITGAVTLDVDEGRLILRGTVSIGGNWQDTGYLRVVGGADGLRRPAKAKHYTSTTVRIVLGDLLAGVGEKLSIKSDAAVLARSMPAWTSAANISPGRLITQLLASVAPAATWRVLPDGTVWVGVETWPDSGLTDDDFQVLSEDPSRAEAHLGVESPLLMPGTSLAGRHVSYVEHQLGEQTRTSVWFETTGSTEDRLKSAIGKMVKGAQPPIDYLSHYFATVVAQKDDKIDVQPTDARIPSMAGVPLFAGLPQWELALNPGGRVLIGWSGGDPTQPYALAFDSGVTAKSLGLTAALLVTIGNKAAAQPAILGSTYRTAEGTLNAAMAAAFTALAGVSVGPLSTLNAQFTTLAGLLNAFETTAATYLSQQVRHS